MQLRGLVTFGRSSLQRFLLGDQPCGMLAAQIDPQPAPGDDEPAARADQEVDMGNAPDPPGQGAFQLEPAEIDDRRAPADGRKTALMAVAERWQRWLLRQPPLMTLAT
jgi:hypothetical protein